MDTTKPNLKIGLMTVFYPRMELDHIEQWIRYNLRLGFDKIYLYDNDTRSIDWHFGNMKKEIIWAKKPEANYYLELSDQEVKHAMETILAPFVTDGTVEVISWPNRGLLFKRDFIRSQKQSARHCLRVLKQTREVDWLAFVDIDELIVAPEKPMKEVIASYDVQGFHGIQMRQKLFESRWGNNEKSLDYNQLTKTFGLLDFNEKAFVKIGEVERWKVIHRAETKDPTLRVTADPNLLRFHHFRGNKYYGNIVKWNLPRYMKQKLTGETDDTHCRWLD